MTADTTFKEFVEEMGLKFSLLDFGSRKYKDLVEAFNRVKFELEAAEEALEHEKIRARLTPNGQSATKDFRGPVRPPKRGARFAAHQL
jgi:hypothetical protein